MASTGVQMEAGYTKIHRWLEFQFRQMTRDAQLEVSGVMREAVRRLGQRPGMLKWVVQEAICVVTTNNVTGKSSTSSRPHGRHQSSARSSTR